MEMDTGRLMAPAGAAPMHQGVLAVPELKAAMARHMLRLAAEVTPPAPRVDLLPRFRANDAARAKKKRRAKIAAASRRKNRK